jgi:hypothetical protein
MNLWFWLAIALIAGGAFIQIGVFVGIPGIFTGGTGVFTPDYLAIAMIVAGVVLFYFKR